VLAKHTLRLFKGRRGVANGNVRLTNGARSALSWDVEKICFGGRGFDQGANVAGGEREAA
jgi:hypothetical protein